MIVHTPTDVAKFLTESLKGDTNFVSAVVKPPTEPVGTLSQGAIFLVRDAVIVQFKDVNAPKCESTLHDLVLSFLKKEDFPNFKLIPGHGNTFSVLLL